MKSRGSRRPRGPRSEFIWISHPGPRVQQPTGQTSSLRGEGLISCSVGVGMDKGAGSGSCSLIVSVFAAVEGSRAFSVWSPQHGPGVEGLDQSLAAAMSEMRRV